MTDVKRLTLREEQAALTRRRILDAARQRFFQDGYAATTLKAIAVDAGVAVQTVYAVFGSKAAILDDLRSMAVNQPAADDAVASAFAPATIDARLAAFARAIRLRWESVGDIVRINEDAARADPKARAGVALALEQRQRGITEFAKALRRDLAPGLDVARTVAVLDALSLYETYARLVDAHRWSADAYETWLVAALVEAVGRQPGVVGRPSSMPMDASQRRRLR